MKKGYKPSNSGVQVAKAPNPPKKGSSKGKVQTGGDLRSKASNKS